MVPRMPRGRLATAKKQIGLAYFGVLLIVFLMSIGLGKSMEVYSAAQQRMKESELLFVGGSYREAIRSFYAGSPAIKQYPSSIDELLEDKRFPVVKRHLRKAYLDPMTGNAFNLVRSADGRIIGVRSTSRRAPLKRADFPRDYQHFMDAKYLSDWEFSYRDES